MNFIIIQKLRTKKEGMIHFRLKKSTLYPPTLYTEEPFTQRTRHIYITLPTNNNNSGKIPEQSEEQDS